MAPSIRFVAALSVCTLLAVPIHAQELTPEQQEVWTAVEALVDHFTSGELEAAYEYLHPELVWWNTGNSVPGSRDEAWELDNAFAMYAGKWLAHTLTPLAVVVSGDAAAVYAYQRGFREDTPGGNASWATMRLVFVMKKEDGRWLQLANYLHFEENL
jgi:ketosteroid isomerase-like protein